MPSFDTDELLEADRFVQADGRGEAHQPGLRHVRLGTKWNEPFFNGKGGIIIDVDSRVSV